MLQREASALAGQPVQSGQSQAAAAQQQPKWPAGGASTAVVSSEQLSLELHQVEREIGKRTREMALVREWGGLLSNNRKRNVAVCPCVLREVGLEVVRFFYFVFCFLFFGGGGGWVASLLPWEPGLVKKKKKRKSGFPGNVLHNSTSATRLRMLYVTCNYMQPY